MCESCGARSADCEHAKQRKTNLTAPARPTTALKRAQVQLAAREAAAAAERAEITSEKKRLAIWKDHIAKTGAAREANKAARVAKAEQKEEARLARIVAAFTTTSPSEEVQLLPAVEGLVDQQEGLNHARGSLCTNDQFRRILLVAVRLVKEYGLKQTAANTITLDAQFQNTYSTSSTCRAKLREARGK